MSVATFFGMASLHAEQLLREHRPVGSRCHPLYKNRACELATRAITRAMVMQHPLRMRLGHEDARRARDLLEGWEPEYQNDVPERFRTFARQARERGW